jgi:phosphoenolpyruvate carboxykinase (GTP)
VFLGSIMSSEKTAAAAGTVGEVRRDPFAMLPFCGYNMGDYFAHWLKIGGMTGSDRLPKLFFVNWFRKSPEGKFLWPGFGENSRVLKWVLERVAGEGQATETPIGLVPTVEALDTAGLAMSEDQLAQLLKVDEDEWRQEVPLIDEHFRTFGERLPEELRDELRELEKRLAG